MRAVIVACVVVFGGICAAAWLLLDVGSAAAYTFSVLAALFCSLVPTVVAAVSRHKKSKTSSSDIVLIRGSASGSPPPSTSASTSAPASRT